MIDLYTLADKYGTEREKQIAYLIGEGASNVDVAAELGITPSRVRGAMSTLRARAARKGEGLPEPAPEGFSIKKTSTNYGPNGELRQRWVTIDRDKAAKISALFDAVQVLAEPFKGLAPLVAPPADVLADLLCIYPMGDPHLGMYAWAAETGNDFDLEIAEADIYQAVDYLVAAAPAAETALIANLGDFFHADDSSNRTSRSGHALDVDSRYAKVYAVGIRVMRRIIDRCLEKHKNVHVVCEIGNHDDHSALTLALCLAEYYSENPRVRIDTSPSTFHWLKFGKNFIGITHGHNTKASDLPNIMASERPIDWGNTEHRFWYTGHIHHDSMKELRGCTVETFRTLAGRDAWAASKGFKSGRDMKVDVIHREFGRQARHIVNVQRLRSLGGQPANDNRDASTEQREAQG